MQLKLILSHMSKKIKATSAVLPPYTGSHCYCDWSATAKLYCKRRLLKAKYNYSNRFLCNAFFCECWYACVGFLRVITDYFHTVYLEASAYNLKQKSIRRTEEDVKLNWKKCCLFNRNALVIDIVCKNNCI